MILSPNSCTTWKGLPNKALPARPSGDTTSSTVFTVLATVTRPLPIN